MASVGFTGGSKIEAHLKGIAERAKRGKSVSVGFMEGAKYPDGTQVAYVAAIQNFGAPEVGIPPRPFFSGMVKEKSPQWGNQLGRVLKITQFNGMLALEKMGEGISGQLRDSIRNTNDPPLSPETIHRKGFSTPLIDTAHMLNSVQYEVDGTVHEVTE